MSGPALIALVFAVALAATRARADDPPAPGAARPAVPSELRDTLPGGSRLGDAPELPVARLDVLPQPTQVRIRVRRAPERKD